MDLFAKCYETFIQDEIRDMGLYPYFHALESRQDVDRDHGRRAAHHAGLQ